MTSTLNLYDCNKNLILNYISVWHLIFIRVTVVHAYNIYPSFWPFILPISNLEDNTANLDPGSSTGARSDLTSVGSLTRMHSTKEEVFVSFSALPLRYYVTCVVISAWIYQVNENRTEILPSRRSLLQGRMLITGPADKPSWPYRDIRKPARFRIFYVDPEISGPPKFNGQLKQGRLLIQGCAWGHCFLICNCHSPSRSSSGRHLNF